MKDEAMSAPEVGEAVHYHFEFRGSGSEYFRIWIVNLLLTILTLGIFSAWAKVRSMRYFYGNTFLDDANFEYHASPWAILIARLLMAALFVGGAYWAGESLARNAAHSLLLACFLPWAHVRGLVFNARYSSYRSVCFGFQKNNAVYGQMYLIYLPFIAIVLLQYLSASGVDFLDIYNTKFGTFFEHKMTLLAAAQLLALLLFFMLLPWMLRAYQRLKAENHRWGRLSACFMPPSISAYMVCCWFLPLVGIVVLLIFYSLVFSAGGSTVVFLFSYLLAVIILSLMYVQLFRWYWQSLALPGGGRMQCCFSTKIFAVNIIFVNYFAIVLSLGLLYPWAKVRKTRFLAQHMRLVMPVGAMDDVLAGLGVGEGALGGEFEAVEGFGFDFGLI